jgi:type I restriction enzyme S subunit
VLEDYVSVQSGYAFKSEWFEPEGVRLVRNVNIGHGTVLWDQTARISESRRAEFGGFELNLGDVLVSLDRPIISSGVKVARVRQSDLPSLLLQRVGRCVIRTPNLDPEYLFLWLRSPRFVGAIDPGRSNGVPHISPKDIERIPFAAPSIEEQVRVVQRLRGIQTRERALSDLRTRVESAAAALVPSVLRKEM